MIPALISLKSLIKNKSYHIDYSLFRLHYQVTVCALMAFCLILTAKILFGDTIDCKGRMEVRDDFIDNLCYSQGTFTRYAIQIEDIEQVGPINPQVVPNGLQAGPSPDYDSAIIQQALYRSPGVQTRPPNGSYENRLNQVLAGTTVGEIIKKNFRMLHRLFKNNNIYFASSARYVSTGLRVPSAEGDAYITTYWHRYYQYMPIILFLQAVFFYFPHYLWKVWENGVVSSICKRLYDNRFSPAEFIESNYHIIDYLHNCFTYNKSLVYKYYFCHLLLLINIIGQIVILDCVFNGQFITYGLDVFYYLFIDNNIYGLEGATENVNDLNNPMNFVFPKLTGCTVTKLSEAGNTPDTTQFMCVLPLNILHDKFFLIMWFWLLFLVALTFAQLVFDIFYFVIAPLRLFVFRRRFGPYLHDSVKHTTSLSEIFLLDLIGSNSDRFAFSALLRKLDKDDWHASSPSENESLV